VVACLKKAQIKAPFCQIHETLSLLALLHATFISISSRSLSYNISEFALRNCRKTKHILSLEQQLLQAAQEELEETLKMIEADRQRISVLQQEQTFTVRQIKDAMCQGKSRQALL